MGKDPPLGDALSPITKESDGGGFLEDHFPFKGSPCQAPC